MKSIDINCDLGEGFKNDSEIMPFISSANIACGGHAGNEESIYKSIKLAQKHNISIGAHPSFNDIENFGRKAIHLPSKEIRHIVYSQLKLFKKISLSVGVKIHHTKPHGALYNMAINNYEYAKAIGLAIKDIDPNIFYYGFANSNMIKAAIDLNLKYKNEVFIDRNYDGNGNLISRNNPEAVINNADECKNRALRIVTQNKINTISNCNINISPDTICFHGDNSNSIEIAKCVYNHLIKNNIKVSSND